MDPIDRQQAIDALRNHFTDGFDEDRWWNSTHVLAVLKDVQSAQKKGKWFIEPNKGTITCSTCKEEISYYPAIGIKPIWNYCPYCGSYNGGEQE